jgi:hypothetical protein
LLRQWGLLQGWLEEDTGLLSVLDGIKRSARDWAANAKASSWLAHGTDRLRAVERLLARPDLKANLEPTDTAYVVACQRQASRNRARAVAVFLLAVMAMGYFGHNNWNAISQAVIASWPSRFVIAAYLTHNGFGVGKVAPLTPDRERELDQRPGEVFRECPEPCPEMVIIGRGHY